MSLPLWSGVWTWLWCGLLGIALVFGSGPRTVGLSASVRCTCSDQSRFQVSYRKLPVAVQCFCVDGDWGKFFLSVVVLASLLGSHIIAAVCAKWLRSGTVQPNIHHRVPPPESFHAIPFNGKAKHKSDGQKRSARQMYLQHYTNRPKHYVPGSGSTLAFIHTTIYFVN
jgi:hypothetical protein